MTRQMIENITKALAPFWGVRSRDARTLIQMERAVSAAVNIPATVAIEYPGVLVRLHMGDGDIHRIVVPAPVPSLLSGREV